MKNVNVHIMEKSRNVNTSGAFVEEELRLLPYVSIIKEAGAKKYLCTVCDIRFSSPSATKQHVQGQHTDLKCPLCNEEFTTTNKKKDHLVKTHDVNLKKFICDICKRQYTTKKGLQVHITHLHMLQQCPDCPSKFISKELIVHRHEVHKTLLPTCGVCGYKNKNENRMRIHQRQVHLKEKTVPCEFCDRTFFNMIFLRRHLIKHKPEKIHECKFCHKKFPRTNTLRMHEKIHKGEKNKVCELCGVRFVQKASLNYHMVKHHPEAC